MHKGLQIRLLNRNSERIPYELLLLADETMEAIDRYVHHADILVAEADDVMVGVCVLKEINKDVVEIKNIAVAGHLQGHGIGSLLLREAVRCATLRGCHEVWIGTGDCLHGQLRLYQREGFEVFDRRINFFIDNYPYPIYEDGVQLKDMVMLRKKTVH